MDKHKELDMWEKLSDCLSMLPGEYRTETFTIYWSEIENNIINLQEELGINQDDQDDGGLLV